MAQDSGFERLELIVYGDNERARRLYESVGFTLEGTKRNARKIDGRYQDEVVMAMCFDLGCALNPPLQEKRDAG